MQKEMTEAAVNKSAGKEQRPLNIFKASAGSGKTYTLVHRYLDLLLSDG